MTVVAGYLLIVPSPELISMARGAVPERLAEVHGMQYTILSSRVLDGTAIPPHVLIMAYETGWLPIRTTPQIYSVASATILIRSAITQCMRCAFKYHLMRCILPAQLPHRSMALKTGRLTISPSL